MSACRITCATRSADALTHLGSPNFWTSPWLIGEVMDQIDRGQHEFFIRLPGAPRLALGVYRKLQRPRMLRCHKDGWWNDALNDLPECPVPPNKGPYAVRCMCG